MTHLSASMFEIQLDLIHEQQKQLRAAAALSRLLARDNRPRPLHTHAGPWFQRLLRRNTLLIGRLSSPFAVN